MTKRYDRGAALIVADVQNDFADPRGSLYVPGGVEVIDVVNREIDAARASGALVVYTQDWHPESTPHFAKDGGIWPVHCVQGSWGAEFVSPLTVDGPVVRKGSGGEDGYSGFSVRDPVSGSTTPTGLAERLEAAGVARVIVIGLATDYCVKETALDAARHGYPTTVVKSAVRAVARQPGDGERALAQLTAAGVNVVQ